MKGFKFIHCADLHLGKKPAYSGSPGREAAFILDEAVRNSFRRLVELARTEKVDFIIIAGDLYDLEARSIRASRFFKKQCQRLKKENIKIYLISGNHDPAGKEKEPFELADNVKIFSSEEVETVEFFKEGELSAQISGQSYRQRFEDRSMYNFYTPLDKGVFNIGILHSQLDKDNRRYVPVSKNELLSKEEIDYWALGHIHQYRKINSQPALFFPGTLQGRNLSEEGPKGVILVEVDQNLNYQQQFIALAELEYKNLSLKLDQLPEIKNISELERLLTAEINSLREKIIEANQNRYFELKALIMRIIIKGRSKIDQFVENNSEELELELVEELRRKFAGEAPYIWPDSIIFRTAPPLADYQKLKADNPLLNEVEKLVKKAAGEDNKLADDLKAEWGRIWQGSSDPENRENNRFYAEQELKEEILAAAENLIISELIEDGD